MTIGIQPEIQIESQVEKNSNQENIDLIINEFKNLDLPDFGKTYEVNGGRNSILFQSKVLEEKMQFAEKLFISPDQAKIYYSKTQKWLGYVQELTADGFTAILKDLSHGGTDEYSDFFMDEISEDDKSLISVGSAFYLNLGYVYKKGTVKKESEIRFQRLSIEEENDYFDKGLDLRKDFISYFK